MSCDLAEKLGIMYLSRLLLQIVFIEIRDFLIKDKKLICKFSVLRFGGKKVLYMLVSEYQKYHWFSAISHQTGRKLSNELQFGGKIVLLHQLKNISHLTGDVRRTA